MARGVLVERFEIVGPYARNELGSLPGSLGRAPASCFFRESASHCFVRVENELACAVARHKEIVDGHATEFEPLGRHCKYKKMVGPEQILIIMKRLTCHAARAHTRNVVCEHFVLFEKPDAAEARHEDCEIVCEPAADA